MVKKTIGIIPRNLIKNKKRTTAIALSIILSIVLITSMEILIKSSVNAVVENNSKLTGKYHAAYRNVMEKYLDVLGQNKKVDRIGTTALVGYGIYNDYQLEINGIDIEAIDMLNLELIDGSFPKKENEIVIEKWIIDKLYPGKKVGDKIVVPCGIFKRSAGKIEDIKDFEFILSGILENLMGTKSANSGRAYLSMEGAEKLVTAEEIKYKQYFIIKDNYPIESTIQDFNMEYEEKIFGDYEINNGYINLIDIEKKSIYIIIIIDIIIAIAASIMIYNIFNMSIIERLKQFGLLRSIGITPLQIKGIVIGEGILLGIVFIPIGIILGINLVKLLLIIIGGLGNRVLIVDSSTYNIWIISLIGIAAIVKSSIKPAKLAANVSPVEALNIESGIAKENIKNQGIAANIIRFLFGYTGKMAFMNLSRNKKRFIATVISISMGVTIFLCTNYSIDSIDPVKVVEKDIESNYVLKVKDTSERIGYSNSEINEISNIQGIEKVEKYKLVRSYSNLKIESMTDAGIKEIEEIAKTSKGYEQSLNRGIYSLHTDIIGCSKEEMEKVRKSLKEKITNENITNEQQSVFLVQNINNKQLCNLKTGDKIDVTWSVKGFPEWEQIDGNFVVEGILSEPPFKIGGYDADVILFTEESNLERIFGLNNYQRVMVYLKGKNDQAPEIENKLEQISSSEKGRQVVSYMEDLENIKKLKFQVSSILYVLFITATLTALVNIINTINMNVITRKREFGMLRAIGMIPGQIKSMIIKEGVAYGLVGSLIGTVFGIACSYLVFIGAKGSIVAGMEWKIHIGVIAIALAVTIGITIISTLIPLKKATDMEIVESIRAIE